MPHLGTTIKALRKMAKLTQQDLADRCGLTRTSITNIEAGKQPLTERTLPEIARALGYRVVVKFEKL